MVELFPEGFEECDVTRGVELAAYADAAGEELMRSVFGFVQAEAVEAGWEERWREFHHGIEVAGLWVGPPWETAPVGIGAVVIDPGQAFGTGSHATTRLCLELLDDLPRASLLDVGCGSGVLAIAAARLGFSPVHAIDVDPLAVRATEQNATENGVDVEVFEGDAFAGELPETEVTVANLTLDAVRALAPRVCSPVLVTSGYLAGDLLRLDGREPVCARELDGWRADVWRALPQ